MSARARWSRPWCALALLLLALPASSQTGSSGYLGAPGEELLAFHGGESTHRIFSANNQDPDALLGARYFQVRERSFGLEVFEDHAFGGIDGQVTEALYTREGAVGGVMYAIGSDLDAPFRRTWITSLLHEGYQFDTRLFARAWSHYSLESLAEPTWELAPVMAGGWLAEDDDAPSRGWLLLLDRRSVPLLQWAFGSSGAERIDALGGSAHHAAVVAGQTTESGSDLADAWVMKVALDGTIRWQWALGGDGVEEAHDVFELADGRVLACGTTESLTTSGRAGWVALFELWGGPIWTVVVGDDEWSELVSMEVLADSVLLTGSLREADSETTDAWFLELSLTDGAPLWQAALHSLGDDRGVEAKTIYEGLLVGMMSAVGTPDERMQVVVTRGERSCPLRETNVATRTDVLPMRPASAAVVPLLEPTISTIAFAPGTDEIRAVPHCECPPLSCLDITVTPRANACLGDEQTLTVELDQDGYGELDFEWQWDVDPEPEATGASTSVTFPEGTHPVAVRVRDACDQVTNCGITLTVQSDAPPAEAAPPGSSGLRVLPGGTALRLPALGDAAYLVHNVYTDRIGYWHSPSAITGTACHLEATSTSRVHLDVAIPDDSWVVVTAATACAEGPAGVDSLGRERTVRDDWETCGPPTP